MSDKYILYVAQDANFEVKSMLIPSKSFTNLFTRKKDLEILKRTAVRHTFHIGGRKYEIENLLLINFTSDSGRAIQDETDYGSICTELSHYATPQAEVIYINRNDADWHTNSYNFLCRGFNPLDIYDQCKKITNYNGKEIQISNSFLVLETLDGKFRVNC